MSTLYDIGSYTIAVLRVDDSVTYKHNDLVPGHKFIASSIGGDVGKDGFASSWWTNFVAAPGLPGTWRLMTPETARADSKTVMPSSAGVIAGYSSINLIQRVA